MKFEFHLLPHNNIHQKEETPLDWKPMYSGSSKTLNFLCRNALYLLSFCIPVFLLCFLMSRYGFAPFGENNLFILEGSEYLSVYASFVEQLHSGNFSLLAQGGMIGSEYYSTLLFYLCSPIHLFLAVFPSAISVQLLCFSVVIRIGLSGVFMSLYLTNRLSGYRFSKYDFTSLLFSLGYSLSSYMLIQYNQFMFLDCAVLFPLLVLTYEHLWKKGTSTPFILLLSCMFFSNFYLTTIAFFFLFLHLLSREKGSFFDAYNTIALYIRSGIISAGISALTLIPGFYSLYHSNFSGSIWPEFTCISDWFSLFSRFMPNNYGSYVTSHHSGSNLYCGLFVIILLFFYLFDKKINFNRKLRNILYLTALFLFTNIFSLHYIAMLFTETDSVYNCFGFILCFFVLAIASDSFYNIKDIFFITTVISFSLPITLFLFSSLYAKEYSNKNSIFTSLIFFVIYSLLLVFYRINSIQRRIYLILLMLFCTGELFINANSSFSYIKLDTTTIADLSKSISTSQYMKPLNPFTMDLEHNPEFPFCSFISGNYNQPDEYTATLFEEQNEIATALGAHEPLFTKADLHITYKISENIRCHQTEDNIFTLKVIPDTPNAKTNNNHVYLTITPDKSGKLYLYTTKLSYIGYVTAGEPVEYMMTFPTSSNIHENYWVHGAYLNEDVLSSLTSSLKCDFTLKGGSTLNTYRLNVEVPENGNLLLNLPYSKWLRIKLNGTLLEQRKGPNHTICIPITAGSHSLEIQFCYIPFYIGLLLSILSILLYIPFRKKAAIIKSSKSKLLCFMYNHLTAICTFLIPSGILLMACIYTNLAPFGVDTFFKNDGSALTIPTFYQMREQIKNGSLFYSWTVGGGSNVFYTLPAMFLNFWICFIPKDSLLSVVTILEIVKIALCGSSAYLYFTRRSIGRRMHKQDYRILLFTTGYSLCSYMLNMRGFFSWVDILLLFPLILLAMDQLMLQKKKSLYILLLTLGILINYNITLYVCIFLVFTFFTYQFTSWKDFISKGIRFALSSILSAGMCFFVLFATYMGMQVSPYSDKDSVFPTFTFYQSFFDSIRQSFALSNPVIITTSDGAINLYCGVACLLLATLFVLYAKRNRNKYLKLIFMLFIFFSSNNNMLSYIWNGFHYQTKVPNRYSFLLIFLLIDISIEVLYQLKHLTTKKLLVASTLVICTISLTCIATTVPLRSCIATFALTVVFTLLLYFAGHKKENPLLWKRLFVSVAVLELLVNTLFTFSWASFSREDDINHNRSVTKFLKAEYLGDSLLDRVAYLGPVMTNQGMVNHVNYLNQFNSFLTVDQRNLGASLGYGVSNNLLTAANNLTPISNAITGVKYMVLDEYTLCDFIDLAHYTPIATYNTRTILKNQRALPISFFVPYESYVYTAEVEDAELFCNGFVSGFLEDSELFTDCTRIGNIEWDNSDEVNNYTLTIENGVKYQNVHFEPKKSGEYYYRTHEFFYLGYLKAGQAYDFTLEVTEDAAGVAYLYHDDIFQAFFDKASKHTMEITDYSDTSLNGSITLPKDGCIYFAIPYEKGWTAYVDGEKVNIGAFNNGTMFITATEGTHEICLDFEPVGFKTGVIVSLVFTGIYLLVITSELIQKRRSKKTASPDTNPDFLET